MGNVFLLHRPRAHKRERACNCCRPSVKAKSKTTTEDRTVCAVWFVVYMASNVYVDLISFTSVSLVVVLDFAFTESLQELYALSLLCALAQAYAPVASSVPSNTISKKKSLNWEVTNLNCTLSSITSHMTV